MSAAIAMPAMDLNGIIDTRTREDWLRWGVDELRPRFKDAKYELPKRVHVSIGFPPRGAMSRTRQVLGCCFDEGSADGVAQLFISPVHGSGAEALDTLVHELVHVVTPGAMHKRPFVRGGNAVGLTEGKPSELGAGPELMLELERLNAQYPFPHPTLTPVLKLVKQSTRMVKVCCVKCGYTCRTTRRWIDSVGAPICPSHKDNSMKVAGA